VFSVVFKNLFRIYFGIDALVNKKLVLQETLQKKIFLAESAPKRVDSAFFPDGKKGKKVF